VFYDASRKLILKGVDGVIFVADSQVERMDANVEAIENLQAKLLRRKGEPVFEAVAATGQGVFETLKGVAKLVLQELTKTG
jgi:hypothetical protein